MISSLCSQSERYFTLGDLNWLLKKQYATTECVFGHQICLLQVFLMFVVKLLNPYDKLMKAHYFLF